MRNPGGERIKWLAKPYMSTKIEFDDLVDLGCMGLVRAVDTFNPEAGVRFSTTPPAVSPTAF